LVAKEKDSPNSWFVEGFKLAFVATLSAELATQIHRTGWFDLPMFDWNFLTTLEQIVANSIFMAPVVSFIVGVSQLASHIPSVQPVALVGLKRLPHELKVTS
jgi:hypothetical protein